MADRGTSKQTTLDGKSPIRAAVLAVLVESPGHGWDVARRAHRRMGVSWGLEPKHIYQYLRQLEADGLVTSVLKPTKRDPQRPLAIYYPTPKGEQARKEWLATSPTVSIIRTDLQVRLAFSGEEDIPDLLRALNERLITILEEIEENAASDTERVSWVGTIMALQRSSAGKRLKAEAEWIEEARQELEALRERPRR